MSTSVPPPGYVPPTYRTTSGAGAPAPAPTRRGGGRGRPKLLAGGLALAVVAVLGYVLFGSGSAPASNAIAQAAMLSSSTPGYRMNLSMTITSPEFPGPISASGGGVVDLRDHAASMSLALDFSQIPQAAQALGSGTMQMQMLLDGADMYMQFPPALARGVPNLDGKQWVKMDLAKISGLPGLSSLGNNPTMSDPTRELQYLRAASDSVTNEGPEQVDGSETTHYHAELSLTRVGATVPPAERVAIQRALSALEQLTHSTDLPIDVWIDSHHLVRRMAMSIGLHSASGPAMNENVTVDFTDYGPQPRPTPPPADQVQDLSGVVAGAFSGGAGTVSP